MKFLTLAVLGGLLTGCVATGSQWPFQDDKQQKQVCAGGSCTQQDALLAYIKAQTFCREVHNYYERNDKNNGRLRVASDAIGAFAGSVVAQFTHGTATKAWAGLSGATNALRSSLDQDFSPLLAANRRQSVAEAIETGTDKYLAEKDNFGKVILAIYMATSCAVAPGKADVKAMKAIAEAASKENDDTGGNGASGGAGDKKDDIKPEGNTIDTQTGSNTADRPEGKGE